MLYDTFYEIETTHWWFVARRKIILFLLRKHARINGSDNILDIGCGTGGMLIYLKQLGKVYGLDSSLDAVQYSQIKTDSKVIQGRLPYDMPFKNEQFDIVTLLDVLEHIDKSMDALEAISPLLKKGGLIVCSVPAYQWLWGGHDELNHHKRRYTRKELEDELTKAGFKIEKISYFNMFLFPVAAITRMLERFKVQVIPQSSTNYSLGRFDEILKAVFTFEKYFLQYVNFPFGVSLIALARKV